MGTKLKLSRNKDISKFLKSKWFRYGFLIFFLSMLVSMLSTTDLVFNDIEDLKEVITLIWTFNVSWVDISTT